MPKTNLTYMMLKKIMDVLGSIMCIIIFLPILIIIMILIKLTSKGPILYGYTRLGQNAKPFTYYKFRTMYVEKDCIADQAFVKNLIRDKYGKAGTATAMKLRNDPKLTPIGRFLIKTSLDEIPVFFSVVKGDMSLVGPRPPLEYEYEHYEEWHKERCSVKPGITGLWQISGSSCTTFDEMVQLDIEYARKRSILLDLKILFITPWIVLTGRDA